MMAIMQAQAINCRVHALESFITPLSPLILRGDRGVMKDSKAWTRQFIACACIIAIITYTGFALFGNVDMAAFWRVFGVLNGYVGWFFVSREFEKTRDKK